MNKESKITNNTVVSTIVLTSEGDERVDFWLKKNLLLMIRALYFCMEEQWAELGRRYNITPAQQHILFLLSINQNVLSPSEIGELGCWHSSTVTRLLKPLKERGMIRIGIDKKKPRYKKVEITLEGSVLLKQLVDAVADMENFPCDISCLSKEEVVNFLAYAQKILDVHKGEPFKQKVINGRIGLCECTEEAVDYQI
ncbi:DNA-binding transcriptional regulator, MarR family [Thalassobacillus cyri]|uniref:DNA-binding transcriptional regulator, MarR family n=1 Tax=Thalassobacillus cyri TaxID=571932 RepID=A0A1H3WA93_9BACI|nr:MarR family transcriptional regulator [Thalassobacillus cyri]SDZ83334.1 DNA-binding transcriptional regulator, MarR family [Thalassobacillus cyri]